MSRSVTTAPLYSVLTNFLTHSRILGTLNRRLRVRSEPSQPGADFLTVRSRTPRDAKTPSRCRSSMRCGRLAVVPVRRTLNEYHMSESAGPTADDEAGDWWESPENGTVC